MKKFKAYFKMMITAVICLAMSLVPGKKKGQAVEALIGGQTLRSRRNAAFAGGNVGNQGVTGSAALCSQKIASDDSRKNAADMQRFKCSTLQRHVFVPTVGPGDRILYLKTGTAADMNSLQQSDKCKLKTDERKIIIFPIGLCEDHVFVREVRLCGQESPFQEDSG